MKLRLRKTQWSKFHNLVHMKIGIDISQIAFEGTGVASYVRNLVSALVAKDTKNEYVLFGASLRRRSVFISFAATLARKVRLVSVPIAPIILDIMWNRLHIIPVEWFVGPVDIFWSSDWTQPPLAGARGVTTIHDLSILRFPDESHNRITIDALGGRISANIVATQKRRLMKAAKSCDVFFCDSEATKKDAYKLLHLSPDVLTVVYPGL